MKWYYILIVVLLAFALGYSIKPKPNTISSIEYKTDTCYITKIIRDTVPIKVKEVEIRLDTVLLYSIDSVLVEVPIPITQAEFTGKIDSVGYSAYVSGYRPRLDSISFNYQVPIIINTITQTQIKKQRFTYGLQVGAGYGVINKKFDVYMGVGVQYNF